MDEDKQIIVKMDNELRDAANFMYNHSIGENIRLLKNTTNISVVLYLYTASHITRETGTRQKSQNIW